MRFVVRDQDGRFFADFNSEADKYAEDGSTAQERAMGWAALQSNRVYQFSVWREDTGLVSQDSEKILVRRWPGQFIFSLHGSH